jgi:hypothetical protein
MDTRAIFIKTNHFTTPHSESSHFLYLEYSATALIGEVAASASGLTHIFTLSWLKFLSLVWA